MRSGNTYKLLLLFMRAVLLLSSSERDVSRNYNFSSKNVQELCELTSISEECFDNAILIKTCSHLGYFRSTSISSPEFSGLLGQRWVAGENSGNTKKIFTITAEIHARSLVKFYCQYADRHMNLKFM